MSYEQVKALPPAEFKRYCGVQPETFRKMVGLVSSRLSRKRRVTGRPTKLSVEDQVLMTLEYWREYRTFFHLAKSWGLHESSVWRTIRRVESYDYRKWKEYRRAEAKANQWETGHWDIPYQHQAEAVEQAFRLVELCSKAFQRAARQLANIRLVRAKTARMRRRDRARTIKAVRVA